ncbi:type IV pilin protein [Variovorax sp. KK3]|uniref:type IV pilin protein n=1 Tax=Variovorax sp. KK3 TaxID=1855728 RepID=UPI00097C9828|nr:type IV pilin protein [Variovorax sp. KK3]
MAPKNPIRSRRRGFTLGFTLIEVMIVVAIVAILAAIAYPSYIESVRKSRRAEARAQLLETAQYMQRFYSQNDSFKFSVGKDTAMNLPTALTAVPRQGTQTYTIAFVKDSLTPSSFGLEASPMGTMTGDRCGKLLLDNTGKRDIADSKAGVSVDDCWR